jgi:hypothetical protein
MVVAGAGTAVVVVVVVAVVAALVVVVVVLQKLGVHQAVDLTLILEKEIGLYTKGTIQNKVHTVNRVHRMQIQTYTVTQGLVIHLSSNSVLFASLHSNKVTSH